GTEMKVSVLELPGDAPEFSSPNLVPVEAELAFNLARQRVVVKKPDGVEAKDIINVAFTGSLQDLSGAFVAAGWQPAEPRTRNSMGKAYRAYTSQSGYATAPVSKLLYEGAEPDLVFQKSLNTMNKRHHIRIWHAPGAGPDVWIGAA